MWQLKFWLQSQAGRSCVGLYGAFDNYTVILISGTSLPCGSSDSERNSFRRNIMFVLVLLAEKPLFYVLQMSHPRRDRALCWNWFTLWRDLVHNSFTLSLVTLHMINTIHRYAANYNCTGMRRHRRPCSLQFCATLFIHSLDQIHRWTSFPLLQLGVSANRLLLPPVYLY